jgi:hypothetical protein
MSGSCLSLSRKDMILGDKAMDARASGHGNFLSV